MTTQQQDDWDLLRELGARLEQNQLTSLSPSELAYLTRTGAQLGFQPEEIAARTTVQEKAIDLLREARERVRSGSRRLMAAMATSSRELLTQCLADPVPLHRKIAAVELARLQDHE